MRVGAHFCASHGQVSPVNDLCVFHCYQSATRIDEHQRSMSYFLDNSHRAREETQSHSNSLAGCRRWCCHVLALLLLYLLLLRSLALSLPAIRHTTPFSARPKLPTPAISVCFKAISHLSSADGAVAAVCHDSPLWDSSFLQRPSPLWASCSLYCLGNLVSGSDAG